MAERATAGGVALALAAGVLACGCGPKKAGADGSASAGDSTTTEATSTGASTQTQGSAAASSGSATAQESSTDAPVDCPDNVANEPLCYRKFPIAWDGDDLVEWNGPPTARVGNFGPNGEEAFLLSTRDAGTPMSLAFWNGDGFDVRPWGAVPEFSDPDGRIPVRLFDGFHSDLVVGMRGFESVLAVAPWTPEGPGEPVVVGPPPTGSITSLFERQPVLDVEGDGRDEFAVWVEDPVANAWGHYFVGNVDGTPRFLEPFDKHVAPCGGGGLGLAPGQLDRDGLVDLAAIGPCEVGDLEGAFAFAAEWGDGTGAFASVAVPFTATSSTAWLGVADFDGDGLDDVIVALDNGVYVDEFAYLQVHRAAGDRSFEAPVTAWADEDVPGGYPDWPGPSDRFFILGDVDADGAKDFIFKYFMVVIVDVLGGRQTLEMFDIPWAANEKEVVSAFDLNHDGRVDFVVDDEVEGVYALISS